MIQCEGRANPHPRELSASKLLGWSLRLPTSMLLPYHGSEAAEDRSVAAIPTSDGTSVMSPRIDLGDAASPHRPSSTFAYGGVSTPPSAFWTATPIAEAPAFAESAPVDTAFTEHHWRPSSSQGADRHSPGWKRQSDRDVKRRPRHQNIEVGTGAPAVQYRTANECASSKWRTLVEISDAEHNSETTNIPSHLSSGRSVRRSQREDVNPADRVLLQRARCVNRLPRLHTCKLTRGTMWTFGLQLLELSNPRPAAETPDSLTSDASDAPDEFCRHGRRTATGQIPKGRA